MFLQRGANKAFWKIKSLFPSHLDNTNTVFISQISYLKEHFVVELKVSFLLYPYYSFKCSGKNPVMNYVLILALDITAAAVRKRMSLSDEIRLGVYVGEGEWPEV